MTSLLQSKGRLIKSSAFAVVIISNLIFSLIFLVMLLHQGIQNADHTTVKPEQSASVKKPGNFFVTLATIE
ncbi:MAG: hypothetical protein U0T11_05740 [Chitinophagaceae bacterium]